MSGRALLTALALSASCAFGHELTSEQLSERQAKFRRMKTTGLTMAILGGAQTAAGAALLFLAEDRKTVEDGYVTRTRTDPKTPIGIVALAVGIPVSVVGVVLGSIGHSRSILYRDLLDEAQMGIRYEGQTLEVVFKLGI